MADKKVRLTLVKSTIGQKPKNAAVVEALGLRKLHASRECVMTPSIEGMVRRVGHLVKVEEL